MADVRKKVIAIIAEQLAKPEDSISERRPSGAGEERDREERPRQRAGPARVKAVAEMLGLELVHGAPPRSEMPAIFPLSVKSGQGAER